MREGFQIQSVECAVGSQYDVGAGRYPGADGSDQQLVKTFPGRNAGAQRVGETAFDSLLIFANQRFDLRGGREVDVVDLARSPPRRATAWDRASKRVGRRHSRARWRGTHRRADGARGRNRNVPRALGRGWNRRRQGHVRTGPGRSRCRRIAGIDGSALGQKGQLEFGTGHVRTAFAPPRLRAASK